MHQLPLLVELATNAIRLVDSAPDPKDVKAGWTAFVIFLLMLGAVVALGFSMSRQFRKTERNREAGILPTKDEAKGRSRNSADA